MATSKKLPLQDARRMTLGMDGAWDVYRKLLWEVANYRDAAARKVPIGEGAAEEIRWPMYWAITLYYNVTAAGPGYVDFARSTRRLAELDGRAPAVPLPGPRTQNTR